MPFGVGEERDRDLGQLGHRQDRLAAELLGLVERCLRIVGADVERDVTVPVRRLTDAAAPMPPSSFSTIAYGMSPGILFVFQPKSSP